jgi:hypothetical protein
VSKIDITRCGPFTSCDAGYSDPRGSGADYETLHCTKCGHTLDFRVAYKDDFYERFEESCNVLQQGCKKPQPTLEYHREVLSRFWGENFE